MNQDERVSAVAAELGKLSQRLVPHAFTKVDREGPLEIPQLEDIAAHAFPVEWENDRVTALELVLRRGSSRLSGSFGAVSRQVAVLRLFNLDGAPDLPEVKRLSTAHIDGDKEHTERRYGYLRRKLLQTAEIYASEPTVRREIAGLRRDLARALTDPQFPFTGAPIVASTTASRVLVVRSAPADEFIPRLEYEQAIRQLRDDGEPHVWLWGDTGTGKTRLARAANRDRVAERTVPVLTAGHEQRLQDQIAHLVVRSGITPTVVNPANRLALFLDQLNTGRLPPAIVFDDMPPGSDLVTTLTSTRGSFIIFTSIERPPAEYTGASIEVLDMTTAESEQMVRSRLARILDADLHLLITALAGRPLAIERTCSYLRETGMSVMDYCKEIIRQSANRSWTLPAASMARG